MNDNILTLRSNTMKKENLFDDDSGDEEMYKPPV